MATSEMMGLKLGLMLALIGMIGQTTTTLAHHVYHYEAAPKDMITREQLMNELNSKKDMEGYDVYKWFVKASGKGFKLEELSVDELLGLNTWTDSDCESDEYRRRAWLCFRRKAESHLVAKKVESYCTIVNREYAEKCAPIVYRMAEKELANDRETIERFYKDLMGQVSKFVASEVTVKKVLDQKDYDYTALERSCSLMDEKYELAFNRAKNFGALSDYFKFCNGILGIVKTEGELNFVYRYEAPEVKITIEDLHRKLEAAPNSFHSGTGYGVYKLFKSASNRDDQVSKVSVGEVIELNTWLNSECNEPEYKRRKELCKNFKVGRWQGNDHLNEYCGVVNKAYYETCRVRLYQLAEKELADHEEAVKKFHGDVQKYVLKREPHEKAVALVLAKEMGNDKEELLNICSILDEKYGLAFHFEKYDQSLGLWSEHYRLCNYIRKFEKTPTMTKFLMKKLC